MDNIETYVGNLKNDRAVRQAEIVKSIVELPAAEVFVALKSARETKAWLLNAIAEHPKGEPLLKWLEEMQVEALSDLDVMIDALTSRVVH